MNRVIWADSYFTGRKKPEEWERAETIDQVVKFCFSIDNSIVSIGTRMAHLNAVNAISRAGADPIIHYHYADEKDCNTEIRDKIINVCKENGWFVIIDDEINELLANEEK